MKGKPKFDKNYKSWPVVSYISLHVFFHHALYCSDEEIEMLTQHITEDIISRNKIVKALDGDKK